MQLSDLRQAGFVSTYWRRLRPLFTRLAPELAWQEVRDAIVEEIQEESQAKRRRDYTYPTYFTYPNDEQMAAAHEQNRGSGLFFSEIRQVVGYRAAEALATLAGIIRLETKGDALDLLQSCFDRLWIDFSASTYRRGIKTEQVRADLVLLLSSNNVFSMLHDTSWRDNMRKYFETETQYWTGKPLSEAYSPVIAILGGEPADRDSIVTAGAWDLRDRTPEQIGELCRSLLWEQGVPEDDIFLPPLIVGSQRVGDWQPPSDLYLLPLHMIRVGLPDIWNWDPAFLATDFDRLALHWLLTLGLRGEVAAAFGLDRAFTADQAARAVGRDVDAMRMTIGQMIKVGLAEFDKAGGLTWEAEDQTYLCTPQAMAMLPRP